jgi:HKD family nuclease
VDLETEELGSSVVSKTLRQLASAGVRCRVLVSERAYKGQAATHTAAVSLQKAGVDVRTVRSSEKFETDGDRVWIGSTNATSPHFDADCIEWSLTSSNKYIAHAVQARFNANWQHAKPVLRE